MPRSTLLLVPLLAACAGHAAIPEVAAVAPPHPTELHGTRPIAPVGLPTFTATAHTGATRTQAYLLGKPTALWFYPAAKTPG